MCFTGMRCFEPAVLMTRNSWIIFCLAYIVGLLSTNLVAQSSLGMTGQQIFFLAGGLGGIVLTIALYFAASYSFVASPFKIKISIREWLGVAAIAILAVVYFQIRIPQPDSNDITYEVTSLRGTVVTVAGRVTTEPRLSENQKIKFLLDVTEVNQDSSISGKLYANVPLLQGTGIYPGERIKLRGILYIPQTANTPNGFDFQKYLARQGIFAGMQGLEVINYDRSKPRWGWWQLRQRVVRSILRGLGSPKGQLVSSMVLGRKAVDLPVDIRDRFIEAGLAHVLAASGFHVSLLLGLVLRFTTRFSAKSQLTIGMATLCLYLGLTGVQPSVLRACLMGSAVLIAYSKSTKVKPLGSLLLIGTIILLLNPLYINDLGFQLSFLATFGLIVTLPGLQTKLDWLPPTIATLIAVPVAASIWVLPLLSYVFNSVATYSVAINIICTPLIFIISLGGMISAIASLILPILGSAIAWLLFYPTSLLMAIVNFCTNLPGSSWAVGQISLRVLLTIYGLFVLVWLNQWWRKYIWLILLFILTLIAIPISYKHFNLTQITVLPTLPQPVVVIQDRGRVILINDAEPQAIKYTVLPFLQNQGINHLDYLIRLNPDAISGFEQLRDRYKIDNIISNFDSQRLFTSNNSETNLTQLERAIKTDTFTISFENSLSILNLQTATATWLLLGGTKPTEREIQQYIEQNQLSPKAITIVGSTVVPAWLELNPQNIIAQRRSPLIARQNTQNRDYYSLKQDGAVSWRPQNGFTKARVSTNNNIF